MNHLALSILLVFASALISVHCQIVTSGTQQNTAQTQLDAQQRVQQMMAQQQAQQMMAQMMPQVQTYQPWGSNPYQTAGGGGGGGLFGGNNWHRLLFGWYREGLIDIMDLMNLA